MLESIDREISFYRRRSGQVLFVGISFEIAILVGQQQIPVHAVWKWLAPLTVTYLFYAVAATGVVLGSEYRRRIRFMKKSRAEVASGIEVTKPFPSDKDQSISEIQVLYVILISSSVFGGFVTWLYAFPNNILLWVYFISTGAAVIWSLWHVIRCLTRKVL